MLIAPMCPSGLRRPTTRSKVAHHGLTRLLDFKRKIACPIRTMESISYKPSLEQALSPMLDLISEDESVSDSFMDDHDVENSPEITCDSRRGGGQGAPIFIMDPIFDCTDDPYLDSSMLDYTSVSEDYDTFMDMDNVVLESILFPCSTATVDEQETELSSLSFAQRLESSVKKLAQSMERSSETRKSLAIKSSVNKLPESLSCVIQQVEESSRCLQTTLCKGDFRISI